MSSPARRRPSTRLRPRTVLPVGRFLTPRRTSMFRFIAKFAPTLAVATLVLVGVASALTSTVPLKEKATGALTSVVPGHLSYSGLGLATHFGSYTIDGSADFDNFGNIQNGHD